MLAGRKSGRWSLSACVLLLPGLVSLGGDGQIWEGKSHPDGTWDRVHAFDIDATVYAGVVFAGVGFSPGEFVDFLAGWFGLDIAGDDSEWKPQPESESG